VLGPLLQALQQIVEGCGGAFQAEATPQLRGLIFRALLHPNRFVRETAYHITAALCALATAPQLDDFSKDVAGRLQDGLSENWSQARPLPVNSNSNQKYSMSEVKGTGG